MLWVKFIKKVGNREVRSTYRYYDEKLIDDEEIEYDLIEWESNISVGENEKYDIDIEKLDTPPKEWILKHIEINKLKIKSILMENELLLKEINIQLREDKIKKILSNDKIRGME